MCAPANAAACVQVPLPAQYGYSSAGSLAKRWTGDTPRGGTLPREVDLSCGRTERLLARYALVACGEHVTRAFRAIHMRRKSLLVLTLLLCRTR